MGKKEILVCLAMMASLDVETWYRLVIWLVIGFCLYFTYGARHSVMAKQLEHEIATHGLTPAGSIETEP